VGNAIDSGRYNKYSLKKLIFYCPLIAMQVMLKLTDFRQLLINDNEASANDFRYSANT
jgi:hypothetical protein